MRWIPTLALLAPLVAGGCVPALTEALDDDTTSDDDTGDDDSWNEPPPQVADLDCDYQLMFSQPGTVLEVADDLSSWAVEPFEQGDRFSCAVLRFRLATPDNLAQLESELEGCPAYLAIGQIEGTSVDGDELARAEFHPYDSPGCTRGPDRLDVHNHMASATDTEGPWPPGEQWEVEIRVEPFFTRVTLSRDGDTVGSVVEAPLFDGESYASFDSTRDPRFSIGRDGIEAGIRAPWYGAVYSDLQVWAVVTPAD